MDTGYKLSYLNKPVMGKSNQCHLNASQGPIFLIHFTLHDFWWLFIFLNPQTFWLFWGLCQNIRDLLVWFGSRRTHFMELLRNYSIYCFIVQRFQKSIHCCIKTSCFTVSLPLLASSCSTVFPLVTLPFPRPTHLFSVPSFILCLSNKLIVSPGTVRGPVLVVANGNRRDFADRA